MSAEVVQTTNPVEGVDADELRAVCARLWQADAAGALKRSLLTVRVQVGEALPLGRADRPLSPAAYQRVATRDPGVA